MKYITLIIGLLVVGCGEVENGAYKHRPKQTDTNESTPTTNTNKVDSTTAKPAKELTLEEKAVGTYEMKRAGDTMKLVFLEDRVVEVYINDERKEGGTWRALGKEVFLENKGHTIVCKIELNGHLTEIAYMQNGKRAEFSKEEQQTYKKIK